MWSLKKSVEIFGVSARKVFGGIVASGTTQGSILCPRKRGFERFCVESQGSILCPRKRGFERFCVESQGSILCPRKRGFERFWHWEPR